MAFYTILTPYLDECGSVYVAGAGAGGSAVRLNERASALWRDLAATGRCDAPAMAEEDRAFVRALVSRRVIASAEEPVRDGG
ncbi:hypothetical protein [Actinomadura litoris]|uniref:hypothetical protein n=1 Tax=Actinomadura litoris TaxID=2678616 RepID=UPI001FA78719|nr:hypothetical protein [Actinomadura litoris]